MKHYRLLLCLVLCIAAAGLVSGQAVPTVEVGDNILLNVTSPADVFAYFFNNETESDTTLVMTFLGQPFPLLTEWYDSSGALLWSLPVSVAGPQPPLRLPQDNITLVISADGSATGRALFTLWVDAPGQMPMFERAEDMLGEDEYLYEGLFDNIPLSGIWTLYYIDHENNCPNDILFEDIWLPVDGSQHELLFSGLLENVPLELHRLVAPQEIDEEPDAFHVEAADLPNSWLVIPRIQTQPFEYFYTVSAPHYMQLEYTQRLALSDCELVARYELVLDGEYYGNDPLVEVTTADLSAWTTVGDADAVVFSMDDPFTPDGMLCATDQTRGETWYFEADPEFVAHISANAGGTLEFDLRLLQDGTYFDDFDVLLTVGNGILLVYRFDYLPTTDWTYYNVPLYAGAGWEDADGRLPTDDDALFTQMMRDATQLHIRGEFLNGADSACIGNVTLATYFDPELDG